MKIIDNRKVDGRNFSTLRSGDVFVDNKGNTYMKVEGILGSDANAVCLTSGFHVVIGLEDMVTPVKATLTIEDKTY